MKSFKISLDELLDKPIEEIIKIILKKYKKKLTEITLYDLIFEGNKPLDSMYGIYLFYNGKKCAYVGKTSSKDFLERISAHLSIREDAWFNHMLRGLKTQTQCQTFADAAKKVGKFKLLLITVKQKEKINKLEKIMKIILKPELNSYNRNIIIEENQSLKNVLKTM